MSRKSFLFALLFSLLMLLISFPLFAYDCTVERIIDGDTFICSGEKVRLIGIDTPESRPNKHMKKQRNLGNEKTILMLGKEISSENSSSRRQGEA